MKNKIVASIPIAYFSQKLILGFPKELLKKIDHFFVYYHSKNDASQHFFETLDSLNISYTPYFLPIIQFNRGFGFKQTLGFAQKNNYDYIISFQEGSKDNIHELATYLTSNEYKNFSISFATRVPQMKNLGRFYNNFTNFFFSLVLKTRGIDFKGDSINIFKVEDFHKESAHIARLPDNSWYFPHLLLLKDKMNLSLNSFSVADLEEPGSLVKLNTKRFIQTVRMLLLYFFSRQSFFNKDNSFISPALGFRVGKTGANDKRLFQATPKNNSSNKDGSVKPTLDYQQTPKILSPTLESFEVHKNQDFYRLDHSNRDHKDIIVVNWCLTNICNFKCTYCPEDLHNGTVRGVPYEEVIRFFHKTKETHPGKKVFFEFTGGEVTYYKNFTSLIKYLKENGASVGIISNGSRTLKFWEEHCPYLEHICLSFHSEQGDPEHFFNVVAFLTDKMTVHVNIMMKPEKFDLCHELAQKIAANCEVSIAMQPLLEEMDGDLFNYTPAQKKILDEQVLNYSSNPQYKKSKENSRIFRGALRITNQTGHSAVVSTPELISKGLNSFINWDCYAGVENICIDYHGLIRRGWCDVGGTQGSVYDKNLKLPTTPILCNKLQCSCGLDIMCTKIKRI